MNKNLITEEDINKLGLRAKKASYIISTLDTKTKNDILLDAAENILKNKKKLIDENEKDVQQNKERLTSSTLDRLILDDKRIESMCLGLVEISKLEDPVG